jgi:hypothetical protein
MIANYVLEYKLLQYQEFARRTRGRSQNPVDVASND